MRRVLEPIKIAQLAGKLLVFSLQRGNEQVSSLQKSRLLQPSIYGSHYHMKWHTYIFHFLQSERVTSTAFEFIEEEAPTHTLWQLFITSY